MPSPASLARSRTSQVIRMCGDIAALACVAVDPFMALPPCWQSSVKRGGQGQRFTRTFTHH